MLSAASGLAACASFPDLIEEGRPTAEAEALQQRALASAPVLPDNAVTLLVGGLQAFGAIFEAIRAARHHVNLEFYILGDVRVPGTDGPSLFELLRAALRRGVAVTIIYDSFGSHETPAAALDGLRAAGARLLSFNPVNPLETRGAWRPNARDHRKILVVDGRVAVMGGVNLDPAYENSCRRAARGEPVGSLDDACWADVDIRIEGPAVAALQRTILDTWARQGGALLPDLGWFPPPSRRGNTAMRIVASAPGRGEPHFYIARMAAIARARRRIWLCSGYFVPTPEEHAELARAVRRGLDVRLLVPGVTGEDVAMAAQQAAYGPLLEAGVRILELEVAVLHAKVGVIDGDWSWVGSSNLDRRSVAWNNEVDAILLGTEVGSALEASLSRVMVRATPVSPARWRERGLGQRLGEWLTWPIRDLL